MHRLIIATYILLSCLYCIICVGCAGTSAQEHEAILPAPPQQPESAGCESGFALPAPSKLSNMSIVTSNAFCEGNQTHPHAPKFNISFTNHFQLRFEPDYYNLPGQNPALAIYSFDLSTQSQVNPFNLEWALTQDYQDVWIGWANFQDDRWDWILLPETNRMNYNQSTYLHEGRVMFAIAVTGHDDWILDYIWFGADKPPFTTTVSPLSCHVGEEIRLKCGYHEDGGMPTSWLWLLPEDANPVAPTEQSPYVTFSNPGIHECVMTASNTTGYSTVSFIIAVSEAWTDWDIYGCACVWEALEKTSLALSPGDGRPAIAYDTESSILLARQNDVEWFENFLAAVDSLDPRITDSSFDLDAANEAVLAYCSESSYVKCRRVVDDIIVAETIAEATHPTFTESFLTPGLTLDEAGNIHVSYLRTETGDDHDADYLCYSMYNGEVWSTPAVIARSGGASDTGTIAPSAPIALDADGNPAVAYYIRADNEIRLLRFNGDWYEDNVCGGMWATELSLAFDSAGLPHVAFITDTDPGSVIYCANTGSSWNITTVPNTVGAAESLSLRLDSADQPHIAFYNITEQDLYMASEEGTWSTIHIDALGDVGGGCSLVIDDADRAHISYTDRTNGFVKYAIEPEPIS